MIGYWKFSDQYMLENVYDAKYQKKRFIIDRGEINKFNLMKI